MYLGNYKPYFSPEFQKQTEKRQHLKKILANKIKLLCENPYSNCKSEMLVGELKGLRSARVTKSFRIIFTICEECRNRRFQNFVGCSNIFCKEMDLRSIIFLTLGTHDVAYSKKPSIK
jgi:mRNA-degrading endonuclease YafQ of YafQ-DinJ toxin-antitoxin module